MILRIDVVTIQTFHVIHLCCSYDFTTYATVNGEGRVWETSCNRRLKSYTRLYFDLLRES